MLLVVGKLGCDIGPALSRHLSVWTIEVACVAHMWPATPLDSTRVLNRYSGSRGGSSCSNMGCRGHVSCVRGCRPGLPGSRSGRTHVGQDFTHMRRATALTMDRVAGWAISRLFAWIHGRTSRTCPNSYRLLAYNIAVLSMVAAVGRWVVRLSPCALSMAGG